jgi:hypothetical protein
MHGNSVRIVSHTIPAYEPALCPWRNSEPTIYPANSTIPEVILFAYAADHSSRPSGLYHARSGRILQQSGPNQEVAPLPGIYFFDGWRVRPCMKISTDLPRTRDPPERDTQRPAATTTTAESPQIPDEEARDILAKAIRTRLMMDLALAGSNSSIQIFACLGPTTRSTSSRRYVRPKVYIGEARICVSNFS